MAEKSKQAATKRRTIPKRAAKNSVLVRGAKTKARAR
jgi:hypothetical protein